MTTSVTSTSTVEPGSEAIFDHVTTVASAHPDLVELVVGRSSEGRPIPAIIISDPTVANCDKQHALIVAGRHGNEESGRIIALAVIDWILGGSGRPFLANYTVTILPNANPDACERDCYRHPSGPDVGGDLDEKNPLAESLFLDGLANRLPPDLVMDLHACGHVGCTHDMALYPVPRPYTEDDNLFHAVAADMCSAAEASGIPQLSHPMHWWDSVDRGICARFYRRFKALAILTETAESNGPVHPLRVRIASGLAKVRVGLQLGVRKPAKLPFAGYPTALVLGSYHLGIVAFGANAEERRSSRIAIWENADHFRKIGPVAMPELDRKKRILVEYRGSPIASAVGIQLQTRHTTAPVRVLLNGRELLAEAPDGYVAWRVKRSGFILACIIGLSAGDHLLEIDF